MDGSVDFVSELLRAFAVDHLALGWSCDEVNAALRLLRARMESGAIGSGMALGSAFVEVYRLQRDGKLVAETPEC